MPMSRRPPDMFTLRTRICLPHQIKSEKKFRSCWVEAVRFEVLTIVQVEGENSGMTHSDSGQSVRIGDRRNHKSPLAAMPLWASLPVRRDRSLNELNGVDQLLASLSEQKAPMNNSCVELFHTEFGNINGDGIPTSFSSPILGLRHPDFEQAIEPEIFPLVTLLRRICIVTYSSCEGHLIDGNFYEAHVGVLLGSSNADRAKILINEAISAGFLVFRSKLTDSEDGAVYPTIEFYFAQSGATSLPAYHAALAAAIRRLSISMSKSFAIDESSL